MSSDNIIMYMIGICLFFAVIIFFSDKFKTMGKFVFNGVIGSAGIYIVNTLFYNFNLKIIINFI